MFVEDYPGHVAVGAVFGGGSVGLPVSGLQSTGDEEEGHHEEGTDEHGRTTAKAIKVDDGGEGEGDVKNVLDGGGKEGGGNVSAFHDV